MKTGSKVAISIVSLILLVGVVIGVVVGVTRGRGNDTKSGTAAPVTTTSKSVASFCSTTNYQDACVNSLGSVANNASATPLDYIMAAVQATINEASNSFKVAQSVKVDTDKHPNQALAVDDCKDLLEWAVQDLQAAFSTVGNSDLNSLQDKEFDILNWFTAVVSYQQSCLEQLDVPEYKSAMQNGMVNATQLTSNAINIVAKMADVLQSFDIDLDMFNPTATATAPAPSRSRRLLQVTELGHDGYPTWFPAGDRKLLDAGGVTPNAVVAQDGSGQYTSIKEAVNAIPTKRVGKWIIYVKAGTYNEYVVIPRKAADVFMYGDGPTQTIVTGDKNMGIKKIVTMQTATFAVVGPRFIAKSMGFQNTAGTKGHQAVAFRSQSDLSVYYDCRFEGYQDTLYYQSNRQYYRNCYISGTIDFIFGKGTALIQDSDIVVRMPDLNQQNTVTADGNVEANGIGGLVLQNCRITAEPQLFPNRFTIPSYLGRPWANNAQTAVIQSDIGDLIQPAGWMTWAGATNEQTCIVAEYANRGPGAVTDKRVKWPKFSVLTNAQDVQRYTASVHLEGGKTASQWVLATVGPVGVPVDMGLSPV
ncbi:hypothetical protein Vadar_003171 [Vaccinium darrowii]|uniref:Uncharacterized protein n=1 Tax=Vaccinium darrowii TaxID=229202 RepID=A0ACB7X7N5_9ERIC|nr:hypothetical protein Vadar_003171 [Vaccinium darrowii]